MSESLATSIAQRHEMGGNPLTVYLKPSDRCTVGCTHCYLPEEVRAGHQRMDQATFDAALDTAATMAQRQRSRGVVIIWHGGEPMSLPPAYLDDLARQAKARLPDAVQAIQTSLIPYNTRWRDFVAEHCAGGIGTSVDFTQRTLKGSNAAYLDLWMAKVSQARSDGFHVVPGMVPSVGELGREDAIVDWLAERRFTDWNIDRYNQFAGHDPMRPTNAQHSAFLRAVFDAVMRHARAGRFMAVNVVRAAIGGVLYDAPGERWGGTCSHDFLVVNPDGRTNACPDKISFEGFSKVQDGGYDAFKASEARKAWVREHLLGHRNPHCATCPFQTFCKSGCPLTPNTPETEGECSGYHRYLRHVRAFAAQERALIDAYMEATR